jgi:hypothetical protein
MNDRHDRRTFLVAGAALAVAGALPGRAQEAASPAEVARTAPTLPQQEPALVRETVGASHGNFERVRELVDARPALAKATWDWGFGDWESALGAASHTGNRDIALYLLGKGARPTLFSAAMLGQLAVVRAAIEANPGAQRIPGPHSITLASHARAGGQPAAPVLAYLESLGDADLGPPRQPLAEEERLGLLGAYLVAGGGGPTVELIDLRGSLGLKIGGASPRGLFHRGELEFQPAGAEAVRVRFERAGDLVTLSIHDPDLVLGASRRVVES